MSFLLAPLGAAISGMSAGTAATVGALGSAAGGLISGNATKNAQQSQNQTNERLAAMQSLDAWKSYLTSRGLDPSNVTQVGQIPDGADAVNTLLPLWADIGGQPAEQALFEQLVAASGENGQIPDNIMGLLDKVGQTANGIFGGEFNAGRYLLDNPDVAQGFEQGFAKDDQGRALVEVNGEIVPMTQEDWAKFHYDTYGQAEGREGTFLNSMLQEDLNSLQPVFDARAQLAGLEQDRINEARGASTNILDTELGGLAELLGIRETGANDIYGASRTAAGDLYDARMQGAQSIYDADLTASDAYEAAAMQALNKVLASQEASRARKGFAGGSTGDLLTRARTSADYYTDAAGQRGQAGQNYALRTASAGEGRAGDLGSALIQLEQTLAAAREAGGTGRLNARTSDATRQAGLLDADAAIAAAGADYQNALDTLGAVRTNQNRRLNFLNLPAQLFQQQVGMTDLAKDQQFSDIDNILGRLGSFTIGASTPPTPAIPNIQTPITSGQIFGNTLSSLGNSAFDYFSTQNLINQINRGGGGSGFTVPSWNSGSMTDIPLNIGG